MATGSGTWRATIDRDWVPDGNWLENQHPEDGHTASFDGNETGYGGASGCDGLPNVNLPNNAAWTVHFSFTANYTLSLSALLAGAAAGDIEIDSAGAIINPFSNGPVIDDFGTATIRNGHLLIFAGAPYTGNVVLAGGALDLFQFINPGRLDGNVSASADNSEVDWNKDAGGPGTLIGSFDAGGYTVTHSNPTGASLICDNAANLNLGADVPELDIEIQADTVLTRALAALNVTMTAGILNDGGLNSELLGSFVRNGGTFASTGIWTFSGSGNLKNAAYGGRFGGLVISGTMANTGIVYTRKATVTGTLGGTTNELAFFQPIAGWWGPQTGEVNCDVGIFVSKGAPGNDITLNNRMLRIYGNENNSLTIDAAIDTGAGTLWVYGDGAGVSQTLVVPGHRLRCGAFTIGDNNSSGKGIVSFTGSGVAEIASFAAGNAANVGNEYNLGAYSFLMGGLGNGADVAVTADHAHVHDGTLEHLDEVGTSGTIYRFGDSSGDNNNGNMTVVQCPAPIGPGAALMSA